MDVELNVDIVAPRNQILRSLHGHDFGRLRPFLELVPLVPRRILQPAKVPVEYLYFIEEGLVSVQAAAAEQESVEVWLIGREGVVGGPAVLGTSISPLRHVVQVGGKAYRIAVDDLTDIIDTMPELRRALLTYLHVALMQSAQSTACSLRHAFPQRLARWLLTAQDRCGRDELPITQDCLARTLGVRRATVSEAMTSLESKGVLGRLRGLIRIRDRGRLEQISCRCYRIFKREQERPLRMAVDQMPMFAFASELFCFV